MSISPNTKTTICCDNLKAKLQQAGVIESRITRNNHVQEYINFKACNLEKWKTDIAFELYPVEFEDGGDKMIAEASNGHSAWNVAEYASCALKDDVLRCFEQRDNAFRNVYDDKYLKDGEAVTPDGKPFGNAVSGVHPKFIKPLKNNPDKSIFVIPLNGKGCRTTIVDNENIWATKADVRSNNKSTVHFPKGKDVVLYNPDTKEQTKATPEDVVEMFNHSRYNAYLKKETQKDNSLNHTIDTVAPKSQETADDYDCEL